ncbi:LysE family translocator [Cupriavidus sp. D384]|uniref:LysE family translocator n=1 Tax=Cupriavidus sp. D384 TaxID=1538095 RepID=UPI000830E063|nr:LysE family translocator [Cupriavidus sp. D384]
MGFDQASWQQFAMVAGAHGLALLSPGPDFFLVVRASMVDGVRSAIGVCLGIALGNGVYIALALAGLAATAGMHGLFGALQWAGCAYLMWMGWKFLRARGAVRLPAAPADIADAPRTSGAMPGPAYLAQVGSGFLSAVLNPKNGLFYASLFAVLAGRSTSLTTQAAYGVWMFAAVLLWDIAVAAAVRHPVVMGRFVRSVRTVERATGVVLWGMAVAVAIHAAGR